MENTGIEAEGQVPKIPEVFQGNEFVMPFFEETELGAHLPEGFLRGYASGLDDST